MKHPAWLVELHRQWQKARRSRTTAAVQPFGRDWEQLLEDAGITTAEDQQAALREARRMPGLLLVPRKRNPKFIDKVKVPVESEPWLHSLFDTMSGADARRQTLDVVHRHAERAHPLLPDLWSALCATLQTEFLIPHVCGPFHWREASRVDNLLALLFQITSRDWPMGTLIRDASTRLELGSKGLEAEQSFLERALELLFGRETPLEALGIQTSNSVLHFSGPLTLHFAEGSPHICDTLRFESTLSVDDLDRATHITTTAGCLLTVENRKTTFRQLARADVNRGTLVVATSFPTPAVRRLLEKLPPHLPHCHFGDTDPAGWDILRDLREVCPERPVCPFHMRWRMDAGSKQLTSRERQTVQRLLTNPRMADCHGELHAMLDAGVRGSFEQEALGLPQLQGWPFYRTT